MSHRVERTAIAAIIAVFLVTIVFGLLSIWTQDTRWGWTGLVTGGLAILGLLGLMIHSPRGGRVR